MVDVVANCRVDGRSVTALEFIRKMRGASQPSMLRCSDGRYYVVKMAGNPQGTKVLGNDCLGTIVASAVGLPVPSFASVWVSESLVESAPEMWFETHLSSRTKPMAGCHFGSALAGESSGANWPTEWLSNEHFSVVSNRSAFVDVLVFDVWANNLDHRQAVFTEIESGPTHRTVKAFFIDHGFMFGGIQGIFDDSRVRQPFYSRLSVYDGLDVARLSRSAIARFRKVIPAILADSISAVPIEWYSFDQRWLQEKLLERLANLDTLMVPFLNKLLKT